MALQLTKRARVYVHIVTRRFSFLALLLACLLAGSAGAQRISPSLDVSVGAGTSAGGEFVSRGGFAVDAVAGLRVRPAGRGAILAGIAAGMQASMGNQDGCVTSSSGRCVPDFPILYSTAALLDWEGRGPVRFGLRIQ